MSTTTLKNDTTYINDRLLEIAAGTTAQALGLDAKGLKLGFGASAEEANGKISQDAPVWTDTKTEAELDTLEAHEAFGTLHDKRVKAHKKALADYEAADKFLVAYASMRAALNG